MPLELKRNSWMQTTIFSLTSSSERQPPVSFSSYIRAADSNDVYTGEGYLKATFDKGYRTWKDRTIFNFNKGDATNLTINSEEEDIELQVDAEGKWQMLKPVASTVNPTEVDSLLDTLSSLKTDDFEEEQDPAEHELDDPRTTVTARLNDGSTRVLLIGKQEEGNDRNPVKRTDKDQIFMLYSSNLDSLLKKSTDFEARRRPPQNLTQKTAQRP